MKLEGQIKEVIYRDLEGFIITKSSPNGLGVFTLEDLNEDLEEGRIEVISIVRK